MVKWSAFLLIVGVFTVIHEGAHVLIASTFNEYNGFYVRPIGFEVVFKTPVEQRSGIRWALISGGANLLTVVVGYILFACRRTLSRIKSRYLRLAAFYSTVLFMLLDPLNLSLGPFLYGGDAIGLAVGLKMPRMLVQTMAFSLFLFNRELAAAQIMPLFGVKTSHILLRSIVRKKAN